MAFTKPNVNVIWANAGDIVEPAGAKLNQGWIAEIPAYEFENWIQNRQDRFNAHVNQRGIPEWDATTEYVQFKSYVQGSDGVVYKAKQTHTNQNPVLDTNNTYWSIAFDTFGTAYTKTESDNLFLKKSNNLSDVTSSASARTNLNVYSKTESDNKYQVMSELVGMIAPFPSATIKDGWLACNGQAVSRNQYQALFNYLGTAYGSGDGSATFNLPDYRDEFLRGSSDTRDVGTTQDDQIKSHSHSASSGSAGSHTHSGNTDYDGYHSHSGSTYNAGSHTHTLQARSGSDDGASGRFAGSVNNLGIKDLTDGLAKPAGSHSHSLNINGNGNHRHSLNINSNGSHTHSISVAATGGSETRPRNIAVQFCIKY